MNKLTSFQTRFKKFGEPLKKETPAAKVFGEKKLVIMIKKDEFLKLERIKRNIKNWLQVTSTSVHFDEEKRNFFEYN